jgi:hypothetical protein
VGFPRHRSAPIKTRPRPRVLPARACAGKILVFTTARLPSLLLLSFTAGDQARIKQTARRRRRYVTMSSSSSSVASASPAPPSSEETLSNLAVIELQPGHIVEFETSRIFSGHVLEMQRLGCFGKGVGRAPRAEEVPEPEGELVVFEAFFAPSLCLPTHRFVVEVLWRFEV